MVAIVAPDNSNSRPTSFVSSGPAAAAPSTTVSTAVSTSSAVVHFQHQQQQQVQLHHQHYLHPTIQDPSHHASSVPSAPLVNHSLSTPSDSAALTSATTKGASLRASAASGPSPPVVAAAATPATAPTSVAPVSQTVLKPGRLSLAVTNASLASTAGVSQVVLPAATAEAHKISPPSTPRTKPNTSSLPSSTAFPGSAGARLNKFVRRLHDMLQSEQTSGIVEWRRGLLVLHSTDAFAKTILPKYFNTRNFKTFRRQLNYYGFVHVRSFSTTGSTTTALWVNRDLAKKGNANISSVLLLKRVEPCESAKTAEGRRVRKELAVSTVEEEIGVSAKSLQLDQIRTMALRRDSTGVGPVAAPPVPSGTASTMNMMEPRHPPIPLVVTCHPPPPPAATPAHTTPGMTVLGLGPDQTGAVRPPPLTMMAHEVSDSSSADAMSVEENTTAANVLLLLSKGGQRASSASITTTTT